MTINGTAINEAAIHAIPNKLIKDGIALNGSENVYPFLDRHSSDIVRYFQTSESDIVVFPATDGVNDIWLIIHRDGSYDLKPVAC